jgi:hypothetical protein
MKQTIRQVLDGMKDSQINLSSESARETVSSLISAALKTKGSYTEYSDSEIEEQEARATWVCSICGENTSDVDYDYIGSGTNHLGCEIKNWNEIEAYVEDIDEQAHAQGRGSSHRIVDDAGVDIETGKYVGGGSEEVDGMYFDDEVKEWEEAIGYVEPDSRTDGSDGYSRSFYSDVPTELKRAKELSREGLKKGIQEKIYNEITADGLPEGGDAQAVLESHKLADEIVDNQKGKWIYESPDGGKTVFRRPFSDYDPKNKEEIDWETKEPTGRKFTEYNNGNWNQKDEG